MKVLVTGFKRFATHESNPTEAMLPLLKDKEIVTRLLDVDYKKAKIELEKAIQEENPDFLLMLGLSPYTDRPVIEQYAYNEMNSVQPDENGVVESGKAIFENGPKSISSSVDVCSLQQYIVSQGEKANISIDPGRFVCNMTYYVGLHSGKPGIFVHIPTEDSYPLQESVDTVKCILSYINY